MNELLEILPYLLYWLLTIAGLVCLGVGVATVFRWGCAVVGRLAGKRYRDWVNQ